MDFKEILNRKIEHYGKTEAAYEFAAEEYTNRLIKEAQTEQLRLHGVVKPFYCNDKEYHLIDKCRSQCYKCANMIEKIKQ